MNSKIIGISGKMGAGKTTLAHALQQNLEATLLCWDDFDDISTSPSNYVEWYHRGQDYNEWNYQALAGVLKELKAKQTVSHPALKQSFNPTEYIIFDAPLGRLHQQTGQYIDILIYINVPLDVSLCRHILRDFKGSNKTKEELLDALDYYLSQSRPLFLDENLNAGADLVIDGMQTIEEQVQKINSYLKREKGCL